jgi:hypothetical protein
MIRETVFVCSCRSGEAFRVAHVLAWDDREAADLFALEMDEEGLEEASDIMVRAAGGEHAAAPSAH